MSYTYTDSLVVSEHRGISPINLVPYSFTGTSKEHAEYFDGLMEQRKKNCVSIYINDMKDIHEFERYTNEKLNDFHQKHFGKCWFEKLLDLFIK